jgi:hypothetical protein
MTSIKHHPRRVPTPRPPSPSTPPHSVWALTLADAPGRHLHRLRRVRVGSNARPRRRAPPNRLRHDEQGNDEGPEQACEHGQAVACAIAACLALVACVGAGCRDGNQPPIPRWTVGQAESITSVRGLPVRVRYCRGGGRRARGDGTELYSRFECLAGTRTRFQRYDTVGVFYVLHPLEHYKGPRSRHRLTNVRFVGGPGIP